MQWSQEDENKFYIYGGEQNGGVDLVRDLWEYNILTNTWTELSSSNAVIPEAAIYGVFVVTEEDQFYVAFGETNNRSAQCLTNSTINSQHSLSDDTYKYDDGKWEKQEFTASSPRLKRPAYTYNPQTEKIFVYGGFDIVCEPGKVGFDEYNRNMYSLDV